MRFSLRILGAVSAFLLAGPAIAAGPTHDWNGFFAGLNAGYDYGHADLSFSGIGTSAFNTLTGVQIGVDGGYNKQFGHFVAGVELSAASADLNGDRPCPNPTFTCGTRLNGIFDASGRLGYALGDALLFAKGGLAGADMVHRLSRAGGPDATDHDTMIHGYLAGAGAEYAFSPAFSGKLEYNYLHYGDEKSSDTFGEVLHDKVLVNVIKIGVDYKF